MSQLLIQLITGSLGPKSWQQLRQPMVPKYWGIPIGMGSMGWPNILKLDRKSTRLNSSHVSISYAVFCLKKKKKKDDYRRTWEVKHDPQRGIWEKNEDESQ